MTSFRYDATPLTGEQVLEHALRAMVTYSTHETVRFAIEELTRPLGHSVLAMRAAQLLELLDDEIGGASAPVAR